MVKQLESMSTHILTHFVNNGEIAKFDAAAGDFYYKAACAEYCAEKEDVIEKEEVLQEQQPPENEESRGWGVYDVASTVAFAPVAPVYYAWKGLSYMWS